MCAGGNCSNSGITFKSRSLEEGDVTERNGRVGAQRGRGLERLLHFPHFVVSLFILSAVPPLFHCFLTT